MKLCLWNSNKLLQNTLVTYSYDDDDPNDDGHGGVDNDVDVDDGVDDADGHGDCG